LAPLLDPQLVGGQLNGGGNVDSMMRVDQTEKQTEDENLSDFLTPLYLQSFVVKIASSMNAVNLSTFAGV
jgi:hypothetical protein